MDICDNGDICRLCLGKKAHVSIFRDKSKICSLIEICCSLQINQEDGLPDKICNNCKGTLDSFIQFRNTCQENDSILKQQHGVVIKKENITKYSEDLEDIYDYSQADNNFDLYSNESNKFPTYNEDGSLSDDYHILSTDCKTKTNNESSKYVNSITIKKYKKKRKKGTVTNENNNTEILEEDFILKHNDELLIKQEVDDSFITETELRGVKIKRKRLKKEVQLETTTICPICGKLFDLQRINAHIRSHNTSEIFTCDYCSKSFPAKMKLKSHMETHTERRIPCHVCGKMFKKSSFRKHIKSVHNKETNTTCTICGHTLLKKSLAYHMKAHTGEKDFECKLCNYKCASKYMLQLHIKSHSGEKPFKCHHCDSYFATPRYRLIHERLHTGETPYQCPCCDKAYAQLCNMKSHFKHNHKEEEFDKVYKGKRRPHVMTL